VPIGSTAAGAISAATLAFGVAALVITAVLVVLRGVNVPGHAVWAALIFLVPIAVMMALSHRFAVRRVEVRPVELRSGRAVRVAPVPLTLLHLVVGAASIGLYAGVVIGNSSAEIAESPFILALPQLAFIYSIAPSALGVRNLAAIVSAYLLSQGAVLVAAGIHGRYPDFDGITGALTAVVLAVGVTDLASERRSDEDQRAVQRARREADAVAYQREVEEQVVALFHDTVLGELTVLAHQPPGPLSPRLRSALERDLRMIDEGTLWASEPRSGRPPTGADEPLPAALSRVVDAARETGLAVDLAGDLASLQRLGSDTAAALADALGQVLVNARQHSGAGRVEIVVDGAATEVVLMAQDAGVGFDPSAVPAGRLGVTRSILGRIRAVGGHAELFTSPGTGTAYLFSLPPAAEQVWPTEERA
jgi:signal transduction histidine kinase